MALKMNFLNINLQEHFAQIVNIINFCGNNCSRTVSSLQYFHIDLFVK